MFQKNKKLATCFPSSLQKLNAPLLAGRGSFCLVTDNDDQEARGKRTQINLLTHQYPEPQIGGCYKMMSLLKINQISHSFNFL